MNHDIFISYSHKDQAITDKICNGIENENIKCWIAHRDIASGDRWAKTITAAIDHAKVFLLVFSSNSNISDQVAREVELAINNKLTIVPIKIEDINPTAGMSYYLSTLHWIEITNDDIENKFRQLGKRISNILDAKPDAYEDFEIIASSTKNKSIKQKKSKWIWLSVMVVIIISGISIFVFKDRLSEAFLMNSKPTPTIEQSTQAPSEEPTSSPSNTHSPTAIKHIDENPLSRVGYSYNFSENTIEVQIFTNYTLGSVYVDRRPIEADVSYRIDNILQINIQSDDFPKGELVDFGIKLYNSNDESEQIITFSNFYFSNETVDISELTKYENIEYLYLVGDGIEGDIKYLSTLKMIKRLNFTECPNITGDLNVTANFEDLIGLGLIQCDNITGDLSVIGELENIVLLDMDVHLTGSIQSLSKLKNLEVLYMANFYNAIGDIGVLGLIPNLETIYLKNCSGLSGDIEGLKSLDRIKFLFLVNCTGIKGDIGVLSGLDTMERIYLGNCIQLTGDISELKTLGSLYTLDIVDCPKVTGSLSLPTGATIIANE